MRKKFQQAVLEMIARDESVAETAAHICLKAQSFTKGTLCSMLTVDRTGLMHPLAGPSLPEEYAAALDGIAIGPEVGSCGAAAFLREAVEVTDIFTDPRWAPYRFMAEPLGAKACWSSPILGGDGRALGAFGFYFPDNRGPTPEEKHIVADCTGLSGIMLDREEMRAEIHRLAYSDPLTGLGNRAHFERTLTKAAHAGLQLGLLLVEIDQLKHVNDSFGYETGDLLIREVGRRIGQQAWPYDAFRLGGGEFAVLSGSQDAMACLRKAAAQIQIAMREPVWCRQNVLSSTVTCGGATFHPLLPRDPAMLHRQADAALQHAKETAQGSFVPFNERLAKTSARRIQVLRATAQALAENRVEAHYQPIIGLHTKEIIGLEALCRVRTLQGDLVPTAEISESMKDRSVAPLITDCMLAAVARDIRYWLDSGLQVGRVGVNVSMADFRKGDLRERVLAAFLAQNVPFTHLTLEVTESVYLDEDDVEVIGTIQQLRADGLLLALDDFGTGYASVTHLLTLPIDVIKIDKSLVDRLSVGDAGQVIIKALLDMAQGLNLRIVVEGVETSAQAVQLERLGCKFAQGYLFGRPADRQGTTALLLRAGDA